MQLENMSLFTAVVLFDRFVGEYAVAVANKYSDTITNEDNLETAIEKFSTVFNDVSNAMMETVSDELVRAVTIILKTGYHGVFEPLSREVSVIALFVAKNLVEFEMPSISYGRFVNLPN